MRVLQIGNGKMGAFICKALKASPLVTTLYVCDTKYTNSYCEDGVQHIKSLEEADIPSFDCAFIATPANTHADIIERLIKNGIRNIYVEKPAVVTDDEFYRIASMMGDTKIVAGYILRQSSIMVALKQKLCDMHDEGYHMELCSVSYQKYLPADKEERAQGDLGVFEEVVHVWDLLFNFLEFKKGETVFSDSRLEFDTKKSDRVIYAQMSYLQKFDRNNALVLITSSFKSPDKRREFYFTFKNAVGERRDILLAFDCEDGLDHLTVTDIDGSVIYSEDYPSLNKLDHQFTEVFDYFTAGKKGELSVFAESLTINQLLRKVGVTL